MKYTWERYRDADIWNNDEYESIEECMEDARNNYEMDDGETIYIGECVPVEITGIDFDSVLDSVEQNMYDQVGEISEGWNIGYIRGNTNRAAVIEKYDKKLFDLVMQYLEEINEVPKFYKVGNVKEYTLDSPRCLTEVKDKGEK